MHVRRCDAMPYRVRWLLDGRPEPVVMFLNRESTPGGAIDFACSLLKHNPVEIWIDDLETGAQIADKEKVLDHCRQREGRSNRPDNAA
jgi:hypothetical protein